MFIKRRRSMIIRLQTNHDKSISCISVVGLQSRYQLSTMILSGTRQSRWRWGHREKISLCEIMRDTNQASRYLKFNSLCWRIRTWCASARTRRYDIMHCVATKSFVWHESWQWWGTMAKLSQTVYFGTHFRQRNFAGLLEHNYTKLIQFWVFFLKQNRLIAWQLARILSIWVSPR